MEIEGAFLANRNMFQIFLDDGTGEMLKSSHKAKRFALHFMPNSASFSNFTGALSINTIIERIAAFRGRARVRIVYN